MKKIPTFDVIVCGSLHLDIVVHAKKVPRLDETAVGQSWRQLCGGKGGNQAVQAALHSAKTALISRIGRDEFGKKILANLAAQGVDSRMVGVDQNQGTGMSVAIVQDDGEYAAVIVSGSNLEIAPDSLQQSFEELGGARVLVLQNEVPHEVNLAAARLAHLQGMTIVFNAAPARPLLEELSDLVDILVVNRVEAEMISGLHVIDRASAIKCLPALNAQKRSVIITLGGDGLVVQDRAGEVTEIAALPVNVTSTHGAGDCFIGVLASALAKGQILVSASHLANEKAAAFVSRKLE